MRRLKNLNVHEVSLVGKAANARKFLIIKAHGGPMSDTPSAATQKLLDAMAAIPRQKLEAMQLITKTARARVRKAEGDEATTGEPAADDGGLSQDAQDAMRAAFRILAPWSEELTPGVMGDFADALGIEADAADEAPEADINADATATADDLAKADDEDEKAPVAPEPPAATAEDALDSRDEDRATKAQDDDKTEEEDEQPLAKADGMPTFADASDDDVDFATAAARTAYAEAMKQRGLKEAAAKSADGPGVGDTDEDTQEMAAKSAVAKSALGHLTASQRALLEPILKSQDARFAELEARNRELVKKHADTQREATRREFVAKAAREYPALGSPEQLGQAMMRLQERDPEGLTSWEAVMKAANAQAQAGGGLFEELGTQLGNSGSGEALAEIAKHVDSVVEKTAGARSREQIEADFLMTPAGKALYSRSRREAETKRST